MVLGCNRERVRAEKKDFTGEVFRGRDERWAPALTSLLPLLHSSSFASFSSFSFSFL
jgi:hypothetical protein